MIILMPMGGQGSRFSTEGYGTPKALLPTYFRKTGELLPMVVCALSDIPGVDSPDNELICVNRKIHASNGLEASIIDYHPNATFIHDHVLLDQAFGCFLAREHLQTDRSLFIGACDCGMDLDVEAFEAAKEDADVIVLSHTNDQNILADPFAHSWAKLEADQKTISNLSIKTPVSDIPANDHATTGMFWFRHASTFLKNLEELLWLQNSPHNKILVDEVIRHCIGDGLKVQIFDVTYVCWGTPRDYENYQKSFAYWNEYASRNPFIGKS